jgi:hypothetical protein
MVSGRIFSRSEDSGDKNPSAHLWARFPGVFTRITVQDPLGAGKDKGPGGHFPLPAPREEGQPVKEACSMNNGGQPVRVISSLTGADRSVLKKASAGVGKRGGNLFTFVHAG